MFSSSRQGMRHSPSHCRQADGATDVESTDQGFKKEQEAEGSGAE